MIDLRTYIFLDSMQPQLASYTAATTRAFLPVPFDASLWIEIAPGMAINRVTDIAQKNTNVKPGVYAVERAFGILEVHDKQHDEVMEAGEQALKYLGLKEQDRIKPRIVSSEIITDIDPYQCMLINRSRKGSLLIPGQALLILEVQPSVYIVHAANEAEKAAPVSLVDIRPIGAFGRLYMGGSESAIHEAEKAAKAAMESVTGRTNPKK